MKAVCRDLLIVLALCLVGCFMVFIYEPILMYANNINDFWFDLETVWPALIITFLVGFLASFVFLLLSYFICQKFKKEKFFQRTIIVLTGIFVCCYIHGNFLSSFLPALDGSLMEWNDVWGNISSAVVCIIILVAVILCCRSAYLKKAFYCSGFMVGAVFLMLATSFVATIVTTDALVPKKFTVNSSMENINLASTDKNFMILLVDAVDASTFEKIVNSNPEYSKTLKDFSYFPDTMSGYAFTRDSVPFIFSGIWNNNEENFEDYSTKAFDDSIFFNKLIAEDYNANIYSPDFIWNSKKALNFQNVRALEKQINKTIYVKQELKYILFKILPYQLKRFSKINEVDFNLAKVSIDYEYYNWEDVNFYHNVLTQDIEKIDEKYFQYIHLSGGHTPFDVTEEVEDMPEENGTYEQKLTATMKIIKKYIERLQDNDTYNNSVIIIMADHGYWSNGSERQNPILYIKGVNEHHDWMIVSDRQVSHEDLAGAFTELLGGAGSDEIFLDLPTDGRVRRFMYNWFKKEENMQEYESIGKAWEVNKLKLTGRIFNL